MKIKNMFYLVVAFVLLTRCSLDEQVFVPTSDNFIKKESDIRALINGVISEMQWFGCFKSNLTYHTTTSSDDILATGVNYKLFLTRQVSTTSAYLGSPWIQFYRSINQANETLKSLANSDAFTEEVIERYNGELFFLRGFSYFNLVRLWGEVPIITEPTSGNSDFYKTRNTIDEVYALIFDDFQKAISSCLTFTKQPASEFGMPNKGAAEGMLSLACLTYANYLDLHNRNSESGKYYQLAKEHADNVISSGTYSLLPDYGDLWDVNKEKGAYQEVIYGIQFTRDATASAAGSKGSEWASFFQPQTRNNICGNKVPRSTFGLGTGTGNFKIQPWFYDRCTTGDYVNDYRAEVSFLTTWTNTNTNRVYITYPRVQVAGNEIVEIYPYLDKYKDPSGFDGRNNGNDLFYLRLSEVYLIKAEAENELNGPTAVAYEAFNKLRERARMANGVSRTTPANLTMGLTKEAFRMAIFDERGIELVGEGHRWYDLVRMRCPDNTRTMMEYQFVDFMPTLPRVAPKYDTPKKTWTGGKVDPTSLPASYLEKQLIWPYPSAEIDANRNILPQNPGW